MLNFEKYHGCGNDFIIITPLENPNYSELAIKICNRHTGLGADGLIIAYTNPLRMELYNQDGSRAKMCGNGIRCLAYYYVRHQLIDSNQFTILTDDGEKKIEVMNINPFYVKVNMGNYSLDNEKMGFTKGDMLNYVITYEKNKYPTASCFMGTYHTVVYVKKCEYGSNLELAQMINQDEAFQYQTNVDFVEIIDKKTLKINTYERGVGFTYACGTGACASAVISNLKGLCEKVVRVLLPYGELKITVQNETVYMEGPAKFILKGETE